MESPVLNLQIPAQLRFAANRANVINDISSHQDTLIFSLNPLNNGHIFVQDCGRNDAVGHGTLVGHT
jgi:hypothetical protein